MFILIRTILLLYLILGCTDLILMPHVLQAQSNLIFSGHLEERFDNNIYLSETDPFEDYLTVISPRLEEKYRTERTQLALLANVTHYAFQENDQSDNTDQRYSGSWAYRWSPRFQTNMNAGFADDERLDRILEESGLITAKDHRQTQDYGLGGQYELSEVSSVTASYMFQSEMYDAPGIDDMIGHTILLGLFRNLSGQWIRTTGSLQFRFNRYEYSNVYTLYENYWVPDQDGMLRLETVGIDINQSRNIESYACFLGIDHIWTEKLKMSFSAGGRYTLYENELRQSNPFYQQPPFKEEDDLRGFVGTFNLKYNGLFTSYGVSLSHDLVPASGQNGVTQRTHIGLNGNWRPVQKWQLGVSSSAFLNRSEETDIAPDIDQLTLYITGMVRYQPNRFWSIGLHYGYTYIDDLIDDIQRYRNIGVLSIGWNLPIWESK